MKISIIVPVYNVEQYEILKKKFREIKKESRIK